MAALAAWTLGLFFLRLVSFLAPDPIQVRPRLIRDAPPPTPMFELPSTSASHKISNF